MKAKELKKALKEVPSDADIKVRAYTYSGSRKVILDIEKTIEDKENYQLILEVEEY